MVEQDGSNGGVVTHKAAFLLILLLCFNGLPWFSSTLLTANDKCTIKGWQQWWCADTQGRFSTYIASLFQWSAVVFINTQPMINAQ